ncbi:MAG: GAF domain-containing protein, partial [Bdellovibrionota bacterium]
SMMTAPLLAHGEILGAISLVVGSERREFERSDLALAEEISRRAAFALYSLNRIRNTTVERDRLKEVIRLYEHFIECRSEDSVSPLTAARLKVELINRSEISIERQATLEKVLEDIDRATSMITSLAKHEVIQNLMNRERAEADQKAA